MKCKKCGFDGIEESGDWITCPNCGAKYFNTSISPELSATKQIDAIENKMAGNSEQKPYGNDDSAGLGESAQTEEPNGGKKGKKQKKKKSKFRETIDFLLPIIIAVIVALLLKTFVFANAVVPTGSMKNTIGEGDRIIASRLAYINSDPERYDIILFYFPDDESQIFVKRVIGLPGETVTIVDGSAFITDKDGNTYETDQSFITNGDPIGDYGPFYIPEKAKRSQRTVFSATLKTVCALGIRSSLINTAMSAQAANTPLRKICISVWETTETNRTIPDSGTTPMLLKTRFWAKRNSNIIPNLKR